MSEFDYLIIGQGIAGTSLAWHLLDRGKRVLVIDNPGLPSSSLVAAGMFNPLTGRKLVKTWLADALFPYAADFYSGIEKKLGIRCLHPTGIYRPYRNEIEKSQYLQWTETPQYQPYIPEYQWDFTQSDFINAPHNGLSVSRSGWVDLPHFLTTSRNYFRSIGCFREAHFSSEDLLTEANGLQWDHIRFEKVINCMGTGAENDKLFNWLPFNPVKGQLLDCLIDGYAIGPIVNQGIFILPVREGMVKVGATYSWHDLDWQITSEARDYLVEKLAGLLKVPFSIVGQYAGIRPSAKDRRPFLGRHPEYPRLYIFNGLGTKGVTLAPFFARQLADLIVNEEELLPEVNIERYFSLYSNPGFS